MVKFLGEFTTLPVNWAVYLTTLALEELFTAPKHHFQHLNASSMPWSWGF